MPILRRVVHRLSTLSAERALLIGHDPHPSVLFPAHSDLYEAVLVAQGIAPPEHDDAWLRFIHLAVKNHFLLLREHV